VHLSELKEDQAIALKVKLIQLCVEICRFANFSSWSIALQDLYGQEQRALWGILSKINRTGLDSKQMVKCLKVLERVLEDEEKHEALKTAVRAVRIRLETSLEMQMLMGFFATAMAEENDF
jgi:hypothetical protein